MYTTSLTGSAVVRMKDALNAVHTEEEIFKNDIERRSISSYDERCSLKEFYDA
jgi:hypothetical protein